MMKKINYRSGRSGEVHTAWVQWQEDTPCEETHPVVAFVAGYNAAKEQEAQDNESVD